MNNTREIKRCRIARVFRSMYTRIKKWDGSQERKEEIYHSRVCTNYAYTRAHMRAEPLKFGFYIHLIRTIDLEYTSDRTSLDLLKNQVISYLLRIVAFRVKLAVSHDTESNRISCVCEFSEKFIAKFIKIYRENFENENFHCRK